MKSLLHLLSVLHSLHTNLLQCFSKNIESITFIGTSYPLQRGDIIVMLPNREGKHTNLDEEKDKCREDTEETNLMKEMLEHHRQNQNNHTPKLLQRWLLEQNYTQQTSLWMVISSLSCNNYETQILTMIRLATHSTHTTVSNTRLQ